MTTPQPALHPYQAPRPAAAYLRASTRKQHLSCDDQLHAIEDYCQREGLRLVKVFRDDGVSGTKGRERRAGWDELLDYVESGQLIGGVVVVWSLDRWARDFRAGLLAAWAVGDHQVDIHTTDSGRVDLDSDEDLVKGALRSRALRVLRTWYTMDAPARGLSENGPKGHSGSCSQALHQPDPVLERPLCCLGENGHIYNRTPQRERT